MKVIAVGGALQENYTLLDMLNERGLNVREIEKPNDILALRRKNKTVFLYLMTPRDKGGLYKFVDFFVISAKKEAFERLARFLNAEYKTAYILLSGRRGSGKGEFAKECKKRKIEVYEMSDVFFDEMRRRGMEINNQNTMKFSQDIRKEHGEDVVAKMTSQRIKEKIAVVSGIRSMAEVEYFRRQRPSLLVAVQSDPKNRFERVRIRARDTDPKTFSEFMKRENVENIILGIKNVEEEADVVVENNASINALRKKARNMLDFILRA